MSLQLDATADTHEALTMHCTAKLITCGAMQPADDKFCNAMYGQRFICSAWPIGICCCGNASLPCGSTHPQPPQPPQVALKKGHPHSASHSRGRPRRRLTCTFSSPSRERSLTIMAAAAPPHFKVGRRTAHWWSLQLAEGSRNCRCYCDAIAYALGAVAAAT